MNGLFAFWVLDQAVESGASAPASAGGLSWRLDLPADPGQANASLGETETTVVNLRTALTAAERRFGKLIKTMPERTGGGARVTRGILPSPERSVLALLRAARAGELPAGGGTEEQGLEDWYAAVDGFQAFSAWVQASISTNSRVETRIEGQLVAQTRLNRQGDLQTIWLAETDEAYQAIHQRSLQAALDGQLLMLEMLAVNARMARGLSGLISNAGGNLLALPLAWRFITEILSEQQP